MYCRRNLLYRDLAALTTFEETWPISSIRHRRSPPTHLLRPLKKCDPFWFGLLFIWYYYAYPLPVCLNKIFCSKHDFPRSIHVCSRKREWWIYLTEPQMTKKCLRVASSYLAVVFASLGCGCCGLDEVGAWSTWLGKRDKVWRGMIGFGNGEEFLLVGFLVWRKKPLVGIVKRRVGLDKALTMGPCVWVYLQKCYHYSVFITKKKNLKLVSNFCNSLLKYVRIKWWKQIQKTKPNKPCLRGTHHFWVISEKNRVMSDRNS